MTARCQVANMSHETSSTAALWALNIVPSSPTGGTLYSLTVTSPTGGTLVTWGLPDVEKNYEKLSRVWTLRRPGSDRCVHRRKFNLSAHRRRGCGRFIFWALTIGCCCPVTCSKLRRCRFFFFLLKLFPSSPTGGTCRP